MEKIISFLKKSNRYKHLVGGLIVGLLALGVYPALYSACVAGACLELKDRLHGCPWDWLDFLMTVSGGVSPHCSGLYFNIIPSGTANYV